MAEKTTATFYAEIDPYELACRIAEGMMESARPPGKTAKEALDMLPEQTRIEILRGARSAFDYMQQAITEMKREH